MMLNVNLWGVWKGLHEMQYTNVVQEWKKYMVGVNKRDHELGMVEQGMMNNNNNILEKNVGI